MDRAHLMTEILDLSQYSNVEYDLDETPPYAELKGLETPADWEPDIIALRFEFPESFPEHPPHLYAPEELLFRGGRPSLLAPPRQGDRGLWCPVSLGGLATEWDPDSGGLSWLLSHFLAELTKPAEVNSGEPHDFGSE